MRLNCLYSVRFSAVFCNLIIFKFWSDEIWGIKYAAIDGDDDSYRIEQFSCKPNILNIELTSYETRLE